MNCFYLHGADGTTHMKGRDGEAVARPTYSHVIRVCGRRCNKVITSTHSFGDVRLARYAPPLKHSC